MKPTDWMDRVAEKHGACSDYKLAQILGMSKQGVSNYRKGRSIALDDAIAHKVEGELGLPEGSVVTDQRAEREQDPVLRAMWQRLGKLVAQTVAGVAVTVCALTIGAKTVEAKQLSSDHKSLINIHYAHLIAGLRRAWATLRSQWYRSRNPWILNNFSNAQI